MMALVVPGAGGRDVTRAKKVMSAFMRGQGRVPLWPIPRRVVWDAVPLPFVDVDGVGGRRTGVVATIRVSGRMCWAGGGILGVWCLVVVC